VETALRTLREQADAEGVKSIAMPRIAAGYGGLSWNKVRALIEAVFADWSGVVYVYEEFCDEE
jgi:O-acetyl-ADP-ribose deacetylase (regulator of RNase III)